MAASAFVSDERVLNVGIGVAELRLANLVQGDWRSGASQVAYQGGIDHLMRARPLTICLARPGWSVQFVYPVYRDRADQTPKASGNSRFPAWPNLVLWVHGCWGDPASEPESAR
jgi:hypothetical protein